MHVVRRLQRRLAPMAVASCLAVLLPPTGISAASVTSTNGSWAVSGNLNYLRNGGGGVVRPDCATADSPGVTFVSWIESVNVRLSGDPATVTLDPSGDFVRATVSLTATLQYSEDATACTNAGAVVAGAQHAEGTYDGVDLKATVLEYPGGRLVLQPPDPPVPGSGSFTCDCGTVIAPSTGWHPTMTVQLPSTTAPISANLPAVLSDPEDVPRLPFDTAGVDPVAAGAQPLVSVQVAPIPDLHLAGQLSVTVTSNHPSTSPGGTLAFSATITNHTSRDVPGAELVGVVPKGLRLTVRPHLGQSRCSPAFVCRLGILPAGGSRVVTWKAVGVNPGRGLATALTRVRLRGASTGAVGSRTVYVLPSAALTHRRPAGDSSCPSYGHVIAKNYASSDPPTKTFTVYLPAPTPIPYRERLGAQANFVTCSNGTIQLRWNTGMEDLGRTVAPQVKLDFLGATLTFKTHRGRVITSTLGWINTNTDAPENKSGIDRAYGQEQAHYDVGAGDYPVEVRFTFSMRKEQDSAKLLAQFSRTCTIVPLRHKPVCENHNGGGGRDWTITGTPRPPTPAPR